MTCPACRCMRTRPRPRQARRWALPCSATRAASSSDNQAKRRVKKACPEPSGRRTDHMSEKPIDRTGKQWSQIVAKAWADESFKRRLLADPAAVLLEQGTAVPAGVQVRVVEDAD